MEFSVMTYNIRLGLESNLETVAGIIGEADVVAVQEVGNEWFRGEPGNQAQILSRLSGLNHHRFAAALAIKTGTEPPETRPAPTADDKPGFGIALLSRFPLGPWTRHRLPKRQDQHRCILSGTVVTPKGPVSVLVTQLSENPLDRAAQIPALLRHAQTQASPLMVLGDLASEVTDDDLRQLATFLRNAAGDDPHPTWPTDNPERAVDHIYISKEIEIISPAMPLPFVGSDHLPVMARLGL